MIIRKIHDFQDLEINQFESGGGYVQYAWVAYDGPYCFQHYLYPSVDENCYVVIYKYEIYICDLTIARLIEFQYSIDQESDKNILRNAFALLEEYKKGLPPNELSFV